MNANELNTDLEGAKLVILRLNDMLLQLQDDFKKMQVSNQSWEIIAKGYGKTIEEQQAEIEALKKDLLKYDKLAWDDLTKAEIESGLSRVKWAELLIKQLPEEHEGRNSWLLNYGEKK